MRVISFHKDDISAASLLHPCKVGFLKKGIELPSGISSFVCRSVCDTTNRCLWWLTDQDYIDGRLFWRSIVVFNDLRISLRAASDSQSSNLSMMQCNYITRPKLFESLDSRIEVEQKTFN